MKLFILLFLYCVITSQNGVLCLDCYTTDLGQLALGKLDASLQDCHSYLEQIFKMQQRPVPPLSELQELRCYKVEAALAGSNSTVIKGCTPEGGCEVMKAIFKMALSSQKAQQKISSIDCHECEANECNK